MAWHKFLVLGICTTALAVGCTVNSGDGIDDDNGGSGGTSGGTGGSSAGTGGTSGGTGGTSGGTGGTSGGTGGTSGGSGGSGGVTYECDPDAPDLSECDVCVQTRCCDELIACAEDSKCISEDGQSGEFACILKCMDDFALDAGAVNPDNLQECGGRCTTEGELVPADATTDLMICINDVVPDAGGVKNCSEECFGLF